MRLRTYPLAMAAVVTVVSIFIAGCGGDGEKPSGAQASSPASVLGGNAAADLRRLAGELKSKTYSVTYEFSGGTSSTPVKGSLTTTQMPPKTLVRLAAKEAAGESDVSVINDGKDQVLCSKAAGSAGICLKASAGGGSLGALGSIANVDAVLNTIAASTVTEADGQTIAGRQSRCFQGKSGDRPTGSACFDSKDGLLLLVQRWNAAGTAADFSAKATSATASVTDSAFNPPYAIQAVPGQR